MTRLIFRKARWGAKVLMVTLLASWLSGQQASPSKEYIRLGSRVIATENPGGNVAINLSPQNATLGSLDTLTYSAIVTGCSGNCAVSWSVDSSVATIPGGVLTPAPGAILAPTTIHVTVTVGNPSVATLTTPVMIMPVLYPLSATEPGCGGSSSITVTKLGTWTLQSNNGQINLYSPPPNANGEIVARMSQA